MKKIPFTKWLLEQSNRNDPIGDLAMDYLYERNNPNYPYLGKPPKANAGKKAWLKYLADTPSCVVKAFEEAWSEWEAIQ